MSIQGLKEKYGKNKKTRGLYNAAIRAECPGGGKVLDLLELVSHMKGRVRSRDEAEKLGVIDDRLQKIREDMFLSVRNSWGLDDIKEQLDPITKAQPVFTSQGVAGEEWTTGEVAVLEKHYNKGKGVDQCCDLLPGRTRSGIIEMARKSGFAISRSRYTPIEIEAIKARDFDKIPGRTVNALKIKRSRLLSDE